LLSVKVEGEVKVSILNHRIIKKIHIYKKYCFTFFLFFRADILYTFSAVHGGLSDHRDAPERLEAGQTVRLDPDVLVRVFHRIRQSLRAQRVRLHEPARVPQHLLRARRKSRRAAVLVISGINIK
jgi:hypothetical protein